MLLIYTQKISPRFRYITKQLFDRMFGIKINITSEEDDFITYKGPKFSYGKQPLGSELFFQSTDLLFEEGITEKQIYIKDWEGIPCFFSVLHPNSVIPFDLFSASFYLLSRYEEYVPHVKDNLGRFSAKSSLAYTNRFLQLPVVNLWAEKIRKVVLDHFPEIQFNQGTFTTEIICEVNEALAYKKKGWIRSIEGFLGDLFSFKLRKVFIRAKVVLGLQKDPYHTYNSIVTKASVNDAKVSFFFGLGNFSKHEKSSNYHSQTYQKLIKSVGDYCAIGLRISNDALQNIVLLKEEKKRFEKITHRQVKQTFCQYSKLSLPVSYRILVDQEVTHDYSMGYSDYAGFRAGTCTPFMFYDLDYEIQTPLIIMPYFLPKEAFKVIENSGKAIEIAEQFVEVIREVNGHAIIHIDNSLFDPTDSRSHFWKALYAYFVRLR